MPEDPSTGGAGVTVMREVNQAAPLIPDVFTAYSHRVPLADWNACADTDVVDDQDTLAVPAANDKALVTVSPLAIGKKPRNPSTECHPEIRSVVPEVVPDDPAPHGALPRCRPGRWSGRMQAEIHDRCDQDCYEGGGRDPEAHSLPVLVPARGLQARGGPYKEVTMSALSEKQRENLPDSEFAFPRERKEPIPDADHVRDALARFDQVEGVSNKERDEAWQRILAAAKKFGVDVHETDWRQLFKQNGRPVPND